MEGQKTDLSPIEVPKTEIPVVDNPKEFMEGFFQSKWYKHAFESFYSGKVPASDVTMEERILVFEQSDLAKFALVDYGIHDSHLEYNPSFYPKGSQEAISIYLGSVEDLIKSMRRGAGRDEIEAQDTLRYSYHEETARSLVKDRVVPTEKLGRAIARLILVDRKLDTESSARTPDLLRLQRKLGLRESI